MRPLFTLGLAYGLTAVVSAQAAEERYFTSGKTRVSLIELFTSEGCSSCPPAEKWLGTLRDEPGLWRDFVPVEFHVNYWDRLGWKDPFASKEATDREYAYSRAWGAASVYTPCVVLEGAESRMVSKIRISRDESPGELSVTAGADGQVHVEFAASPGYAGIRAGYEVQVALLGSGFTSRVTAGENRGETLKHEFVTCGLTSQPLTVGADGVYRADFALPKSRVAEIPQRGLAAWILRRGDTKPLQATGGWLEGK